MGSVARPLKLELHQFDAREPADFEGAFAAMAAQRVGALVVIDDAILIANAPAVAALALKQRLPSCGWPDFAIGGGLMAYGVDTLDMFRRAATFVDKILKGAKPATCRSSGRPSSRLLSISRPPTRSALQFPTVCLPAPTT